MSLRGRHDALLTGIAPLGKLVYSRPAAVVGAAAWLLGLSGLAVLLFVPIAVVFAGDPNDAQVIGLFGALVWTLSLILIVGPAVGSATSVAPDSSAKIHPWISPRASSVILVFAFLYGVAVRLVAVDWASFDRFTILPTLSLAIQTLLLGFLGLILGLVVELHVVLGRVAWRQIRGWNKSPFIDWDRNDHEKVTTESAFGARYPKPSDEGVNLHESRTLAIWCREKAQQLWMSAQLLALIGGGLLSTGVPELFDAKTQFRGGMLTSGGLLLAALGFRVSVTEVAKWQIREAAYREHARNSETKANLKGAELPVPFRSGRFAGILCAIRRGGAAVTDCLVPATQEQARELPGVEKEELADFDRPANLGQV